MKKFLEILKYAACFALSLMLMTSCDKEADKLEIETRTLDYSGTFFMYLYSDDISEESLSAIDVDTVPGNIKIDVSNEGYAIANFVPGREIRLVTPFFYRVEDEDGDYLKDEEGNYIYTAIPMDIYKDSPITKLYNAVDNDVKVSDDEKTELRKKLCEIKETITISPFTTSKIPLIQQGATIVSYDYEQNSFYSAYTLVEEEKYSHKSSLTEVITYVKDNLLPKMVAGKAAADDAIQKIEVINSSTTGKMNVWGRLTLQYMNYYCDYGMRIESEDDRPNELLVNISKVLYGENEKGNPIKNLGFVIGYVGHMGESSGNWEERREE